MIAAKSRKKRRDKDGGRVSKSGKLILIIIKQAISNTQNVCTCERGKNRDVLQGVKYGKVQRQVAVISAGESHLAEQIENTMPPAYLIDGHFLFAGP